MVSAQQVDSMTRIDQWAKTSNFGKINNENIIYFGMDSTFSSLGIWYKKLNVDVDFKTNAAPFSIPIGFIDNERIVAFQFEHGTKDENGDKLVELNISSGETKHLVYVKDISVPWNLVCIDKNKILFVDDNPVYSNKLRTYMYDIVSQELSYIQELEGKQILKIAYSSSKDLIAYLRRDDDSSKYVLEVFDGESVLQVNEYAFSNSESRLPFTFNDNGTELYFVENDENTIIYKYVLSSKTTNRIFNIPKGVKCIELSQSKDKLLLSLEIEDDELYAHYVSDYSIVEDLHVDLQYKSKTKLFYIKL